jgi:single-stranded DNA-binding protein
MSVAVAAGFNHCHFGGNVFHGVRVFRFGDKRLAHFVLQIRERLISKRTGDSISLEEHIPCVAWGDIVDEVEAIAKEGATVRVYGRLHWRRWVDHNNEPQHGTELVISSLGLVKIRKCLNCRIDYIPSEGGQRYCHSGCRPLQYRAPLKASREDQC